jgi:hypothetical protein
MSLDMLRKMITPHEPSKVGKEQWEHLISLTLHMDVKYLKIRSKLNAINRQVIVMIEEVLKNHSNLRFVTYGR